MSTRVGNTALTTGGVHGLLVVEEATVTSQHQDSSGHIAVVATAASRVTNLG